MGANFQCQPDTPQQENGRDCGVISCIFAEYLSTEARLTFTQQDIPLIRQYMMAKIMTGELPVEKKQDTEEK